MTTPLQPGDEEVKNSHLTEPIGQTVPGEVPVKSIRPVAYVTEDDHKRLLAEKWVSVEATPMGFDVPCTALYTGKQVDMAVLDERDRCAKIVDMLAVEFARAQTGGAWRAVKHAANMIRNGWHGAGTDRLTPNEKESASPSPLVDAQWVEPELRKRLDGGLIEALERQRQVDEDGTEVGVSREAVDHAVQILSALRTHLNTALSGETP